MVMKMSAKKHLLEEIKLASPSHHMVHRTSVKQNSRAFQGQKRRFQLRSLNQNRNSLSTFSSTQFTDVFATCWYFILRRS